MELTSSNPNAFEAIKLALKELEGLQGKVGWLERDDYEETDMTVAQVAAQNELGNPSRSIPPRPFLDQRS